MDDSFPRLDGMSGGKPRAPWGIKDMVLCTVVVLVALFVLFTVIVEPFRALYGDNASETLTASAVMNLVWNAVMVCAVIWFVRRAGGTTGDLGLALPAETDSRLKRIALFTLATFFLMYIIVIAYGVLIDVTGADFLEPAEQVPEEVYDSDVALAVLGVAIVFGAPFAEEILFRGFLYGGTRPLTGVLVAALLTGFIFSLAHYNQGLVIPFTLIGALLALSYQRSGSLFVPIGAHFLFNLASFSILVLVPEARPE